jgi:uncharacterized protein (UPF0332 family)
MTARELMLKAERAVQSAKLLLQAKDTDGACNRAYYAMFDAARAALLACDAPTPAEVARTHGGLISAFSLHLVKPGRVQVELGRALNRAEEIRLIADYRGDSVEPEQAAWMVEQAEGFVRAMEKAFMPRSGSGSA